MIENLKIKHAKEILELFISNQEPFSIVSFKEAIIFEPKLPIYIYESFDEIILFKLSNYTLSTAKIENNILSFEAGFGKKNFASIVNIPLHSILQILQEDTIIFVNPFAKIEKPLHNKNPFANNPKNSKFFDNINN